MFLLCLRISIKTQREEKCVKTLVSQIWSAQKMDIQCVYTNKQWHFPMLEREQFQQ